ncbi:DNA primase [Candidatus Wolfebacteria bacterium]|nr:DNA primase [Candidatus Wolfebacteria bacterium]
MDSTTQQIKEKLDIVDFIRSYIQLLPAGKNFRALCPFHKEKTPSFIVSPDRQTWHCFGSCGEGGDIFKFLMKHENLEFYEALKILAEKAGIELRRLSPADQKQFGILYDLNNLAKDFFKKQLAEAPKVIDYIKERGLKKEIVEEFELGVAPHGFENLGIHLMNLGFDVKDIERAGLIIKNDRGRYFDRFHDRLMFPIHNSFGKVVGFSGRVLPMTDDQQQTTMGKYVNSPETPIFNKSKILYGFHKTKHDIKESGTAVLVEGQLDFLMPYQDGVRNIVAMSGTALTPDHLRTLRRFAENLVFSFDNDDAGVKATERALDLSNSFDFNVRILSLGDFKDPGEAAAKSPGAMKKFVEKSVPAMEFYFRRYLGDADQRGSSNAADGRGIAELKKRLRIILGKIRLLASPIEQSHWVGRLAERSGVNERALVEEMDRLKTVNSLHSESGKRTNQPINQSTEQPNSRREMLAERLLSLILLREDLLSRTKEYEEYFPPDYRRILTTIRTVQSDGTARGDKSLREALDTLSLRSSFELGRVGEENIDEEFNNLLYEIRREHLRRERERLLISVKALERSGDSEEFREALRRFDEISKLMHNTSNR